MGLNSLRVVWAIFLFLGMGVPLAAADLDVAGAKARYESQRRLADAAESRFHAQESILQDAQNRLTQAQQAENTARRELKEAENELSNIESRISRLEREISSLQSDIGIYQDRLSKIRSDLSEQRNLKEDLESRRADIQRRLERVNEQIAELEGQANPPQDKLTELRNRRDQIRQNLDQVNNRLSDVNWKISDLESYERTTQNELSAAQSSLRQKQLDLSSSQRERDRQLRTVADARDEVRRRADQRVQAERDVAFVRPQYEAAKAEWQREEAEASELYAYYQQVIANYNAALNDVLKRADNAASAHAQQEANERAPEKGKMDGLAVSNEKGSAKGSSDAATRDKAKGYQDGLAKASTDLALADFYKKGLGQGGLYATDKARLEEFPKGYNDALRAHFTGVPSQSASVDISEAISSDPGGNGVFLNLAEKAIGNKPPPGLTVVLEPTYGAPGYTAPGVTVPGPLNAYYSPPCTGLVLAEFEPICRDRYAQGYRNFFDSHYQALYRSNFKAVYEANVGGAYQQALAQVNQASFAQGRGLGAADQGLLDGFAKSLDAAKVAQYAQGKQVFGVDVAGGAHLVFRSAQLEETNGDGVFTPGEAVRLKLVVDNYGRQATALEKVRVRLLSNVGIGPLNFSLRGLPALAGDTRTTLQGVVAGPITTEYIGEKLSLGGVLEGEKDGKWVTLATVSVENETHFPLELADIILPKDPKVDETVTAQFRFANRLARETAATKATLGTSPAMVAFPKPEVDIPLLAAGATTDIPVDIKPGIWVGENTFLRFTADMQNEQGATIRQVLSKYLHMDRSVSVLLFDRLGKPVPNSTFVVTAGTVLEVQALLKFHAKQSLPGPFSLRAVKTSDPKIAFAAGSTNAITYGSLSPTYPLSPMRVLYNVPKELKGQKGWVMIQAEEGGKVRHALMVYLDVR